MKKARIQIVEDEGIIAKDLKRILEDMGYAVSSMVASGKEAIKKAGEDGPDLVLMDIVLKGEMDGIEAAEEIRSRFDVPVVYTTAYSEDETLQRAKVTEPYGYILKPFQGRELRIAVEMALYKHKAERKLKESEERYRTIFENIVDVYYRTDLKGDLVLVSPSGPKMLGYDSAKEMIGKNIATEFYYNPEDRAVFLQELKKRGKVTNYDITLKRKDGTPLFVETSSYFVYDQTGEPIGIEGILRDITERKKGEEALRESEEKYRDLYDTAPDMYHTLDKNGIITDCNETEVRMLGYKKEEIVGRPVTDFFTDESKEIFEKQFPRSKEEGVQLNTEREFVRKDGTTFPSNLNVFFEFDSDGKLIGTKTISRDITERKRAEEDIKRQKELTERIAEGIGEELLMLSKDLKIQWANRKLKEASGYSDEEILGKYCYEVTHRSDHKCESPGEPCPIDLLLETGKPASEIHKHYRKDGTQIFVEVAAYPLKKENEITGYVHLTRDITDRRMAEEEIKRLKVFNENIVQSMVEGILIEDDEGYITFANPRTEEMLERPRDELIGKHWTELVSPDYEKDVKKEKSKVMEGANARYETCFQIVDRGIHVLVSAAPIIENGKYVGSLNVLVDVTERKEAEDALRYRALKYKIEKGRGYLIAEKALDRGIDVLLDLLGAGYRGLVISRDVPEEIVKRVGDEVEVLWLSKKKRGKGVIPPQPDMIIKSIEDFLSRDCVVVLDRLDYLVVHNGFNEVLKLLNEINEITYMARGVLLVVVDPDTLSKEEQSRLEKELGKVDSKHRVRLDEELVDVLEFIKNENESGRTVVHKDIAKAFDITRPTAIKRLKELKSRDLLLDRKKGRFKILELTERGKEAL